MNLVCRLLLEKNFFNDTATTEIYTLSLHDALPICTLDDSFIILDEAQNTSREQMKMFLTRLGFGSKIVITGDITQIDLPRDTVSGLKEAMRVLDGVEDIAICRLNEADVVRHVIVQRIIKAYEEDEKRKGKR